MIRGGYVVAALYLAFGVLGVSLGLRLRHAARRGRDWPTAPGRMLTRQIVPDRGAQGAKFRFHPEVEYTYSVSGVEHVGQSIYQAGVMSTSKEDAQRLLDRLPDPLTVRYDPRDPSQSYLVVNPAWTYWVPLGLGVLAILVGMGQMLAAADRPTT